MARRDSEAAHLDPLIGVQLGGYVIEAVLGRGAMGVVYRARQMALDRAVALKVMISHIAQREDLVARFLREAKTAASLSHPNLVHVHDFGQADGMYYYVMELVDGLSLGHYLDKGQRCSERECVEVGREVTMALQAAHRVGIIHRDVKPDNLLLNSDGLVKLADLGLAHVRELDSDVSLTLPGMSMGTPIYMAPEIARGDKNIDYRADFYSLGATLFHLATGRRPYDGQTAGAILLKQINEPVPTARAINPSLGQGFADAIQWLMAKTPRARPTTHAEILDALDRCHAHTLQRESGGKSRGMLSSVSAAPKVEVLVKPARGWPIWKVGIGALAAIVAADLLVGRLPVSPDSAAVSAAQPKPSGAPTQAPPAAVASPPQPSPVEGKGPMPAPETAGKTGGLLIVAEPKDTIVTVDGDEAKEVPAAFSDLQVGTHRIRLIAPGHEPQELDAEVSPGRVAEIRLVKLRHETGSLKVTTDPGGAPFVVLDANGEQVAKGVTPGRIESLKTGIYKVAIEIEGCPVSRHDVTVDRDREASVSASFSPGRVSIESQPSGATIFDSERRVVGTTPLRIDMLKPGKVSYALELADHVSGAVHGEVKAGEELRLAGVLDPSWMESRKATLGEPFVNSLGMKFVPSGMPGILASIWETRVCDYGSFIKEGGDSGAKKPAFSQASDHPVVNVTYEKAKAFCRWLTQRERSDKKIGEQDAFRLPSKEEWRVLAGLSAAMDSEHNTGEFPWGTNWPPTTAYENWSERLAKDGFEGTSPVGSFPMNRNRLFDVLGNVREWCLSKDTHGEARRDCSGASWQADSPEQFRILCRDLAYHISGDDIGFRCLLSLAGGDSEGSRSAGKTGGVQTGAGNGFRALWAGQRMTNWLGMPFCWCPAGEFEMGSPPSEKDAMVAAGAKATFVRTEIQHRVRFTKGFWLGQHEVTQGDWKKVMRLGLKDQARKALEDDTPYIFGDKKQTIRTLLGKARDADPATLVGLEDASIPIYWVSWEDATAFCRRLTEQERVAGVLPAGWEYRLPTEAQWEYACRAGTTEATYAGPLQIVAERNAAVLNEISWYGGNSSVGYAGRGWDTSAWGGKQYLGGRAGPRTVGQKAANVWGLHDMIGNVSEWCGDWYGEYPVGLAIDPASPSPGLFRVFRGGAWRAHAQYCRAADRSCIEAGRRNDDMGFRVAVVSLGP